MTILCNCIDVQFGVYCLNFNSYIGQLISREYCTWECGKIRGFVLIVLYFKIYRCGFNEWTELMCGVLLLTAI